MELEKEIEGKMTTCNSSFKVSSLGLCLYCCIFFLSPFFSSLASFYQKYTHEAIEK